jgi:hypothetical protein
MTDFKILIQEEDNSRLLKQLRAIKDEIGMIEFIEKEDILPLSRKYEKIGNFELDILAIRKSNNEIVMLDHDSPDFEMGNCSKDIRSFLSAIQGFINFMNACANNEESYHDINKQELVAKDSSLIAGGEKYLWFYKMMFGI